MNTLTKSLTEGLQTLELSMEQQQIEQLLKYNNLLLDWNQKINLTAITDPEAVAIKHFVDSIALTKAMEIAAGALVFDVGTGAGFPGIPLKIMRPDLSLVLVDSLNKRCKFLQTVVNELGLQKVEVIHARAEELGTNLAYREKADVVVSRAVARLRVLLEFTLPFVKVGGHLITLKGPEFDVELEEGKKALQTLGGALASSLRFSLPVFGDQRVIGVIQKTAMTPKGYPRKAGTPEKKPL